MCEIGSLGRGASVCGRKRRETGGWGWEGAGMGYNLFCFASTFLPSFLRVGFDFQLFVHVGGRRRTVGSTSTLLNITDCLTSPCHLVSALIGLSQFKLQYGI